MRPRVYYRYRASPWWGHNSWWIPAPVFLAFVTLVVLALDARL